MTDIYPESERATRHAVNQGRRAERSEVVGWTRAGALCVGLGALGRTGVVGLIRRVLKRPTRSMLIPVAGVLHQVLLGPLEAFGFSFTGLDQWPLSLVRLALEGRRLRAHPPSDRARLGRRRLFLLMFQIAC